jgi:hypothetical protein
MIGVSSKTKAIPGWSGSREHADRDRELLSYAGHLRREAKHHARARAAVSKGEPVRWGRKKALLEHWAYFAEVIRNRDDAAQWQRKALISGPLMTRWLPDHQDGTTDYLEFMGQGGTRSLCVKTAVPGGSRLLLTSRARAIQRIGDLPVDYQHARMPGAHAKTCTAVSVPLDHKTPREAAELVKTLIDRLAP